MGAGPHQVVACVGKAAGAATRRQKEERLRWSNCWQTLQSALCCCQLFVSFSSEGDCCTRAGPDHVVACAGGAAASRRQKIKMQEVKQRLDDAGTAFSMLLWGMFHL